MSPSAATVAEFLKSLPEDRRKDVQVVRDVILKNLPEGYEEAVNYGMLVYQVPFAVCPDTYNGHPLQYAALASQKNYLAVYLMSVYGSPALRKKLEAAFKAAGKKLDMGKSCVRFKTPADVPLEAIGAAVAALPMKDYVALATKATGGKKKKKK